MSVGEGMKTPRSMGMGTQILGRIWKVGVVLNYTEHIKVALVGSTDYKTIPWEAVKCRSLNID